MEHRTISVAFDHDPEVNAAAVTFVDGELGAGRQQHAIRDPGGSIIATVTFDERGALAQIELLDARNQIPASLR